MCAEAGRKEKPACGRGWGDGKNERGTQDIFCRMAGIHTCPSLRKKNLLLCLRDAHFNDKTLKSLKDDITMHVGEWRLCEGWGQMMGQRTWGSLQLVSSNVLFPDLSNSYESVCCISNSLSCSLLLVMLVFMFILPSKKSPISGLKMGLISQSLWGDGGSVNVGGKPPGGSAVF